MIQRSVKLFYNAGLFSLVRRFPLPKMQGQSLDKRNIDSKVKICIMHKISSPQPSQSAKIFQIGET